MASKIDSSRDLQRSADTDWIPAGQGLERRYVSVCGFQMSYVIGGHGDSIVLLHGLGADSSTWRKILPELARHYTVYALDMFGCGRSDKPAIAYTIEAMAHYVRFFMDAVGIERTHLIGHSLGGGIAMQTLYFSAERVQRVVLVDSGGLGHDVHWLLRVSTLPGAHQVIGFISNPRTGIAALARKLEQSRRGSGNTEYESLIPLMLQRLHEQETRRSFLRMVRAVGDFTGQTVSALPLLPERSATPFLLIWGEKDEIIPVSHAYIASTYIPRSEVAVIPNSYHQPHVESPARFCQLTLDFLQAPRWPEDQAAEATSSRIPPAPQPKRHTWQRIAAVLVIVTSVPAAVTIFLSAGQRKRLQAVKPA
ncbi:MAG: alpha/beta fold hydrolase [Ktedonobacterales bacterium]